MIGHRDKLPMTDRDGGPISFVDGSGISPFGPSSAWVGRRTTTNIPGLRETPGWGSVAEMMTLIDRTGANGAPGNNRVPTKDQVDYLGYDTFPSGMKGMAASLVKDTSANPPTANQLDKVKDDWEEKLQIAAAAMSSGTVRSDMFAVWFVVQGYQKSDTEGLKPEDVLTPSVAKRYLMVIDRSNVTRKGEQPRVVLFTEVPL